MKIKADKNPMFYKSDIGIIKSNIYIRKDDCFNNLYMNQSSGESIILYKGGKRGCDYEIVEISFKEKDIFVKKVDSSSSKNKNIIVEFDKDSIYVFDYIEDKFGHYITGIPWYFVKLVTKGNRLDFIDGMGVLYGQSYFLKNDKFNYIYFSDGSILYKGGKRRGRDILRFSSKKSGEILCEKLEKFPSIESGYIVVFCGCYIYVLDFVKKEYKYYKI